MTTAGVGVDDDPFDQRRAAIGGEDDSWGLEIVLIVLENRAQVMSDGFASDGASFDAAATEVAPETFRDRNFLAIPEEAEALDDAVAWAQPARQAFAFEGVARFLAIRGLDGFLRHLVVPIDQGDFQSQQAFAGLEGSGIHGFLLFPPLCLGIVPIRFPFFRQVGGGRGAEANGSGGCEGKKGSSFHGVGLQNL